MDSDRLIAIRRRSLHLMLLPDGATGSAKTLMIRGQSSIASSFPSARPTHKESRCILVYSGIRKAYDDRDSALLIASRL